MSGKSFSIRTITGLTIVCGLMSAAWATTPNFRLVQNLTGYPMNYSIYAKGVWAIDVDYNTGWVYSLRRSLSDGKLTSLNSVRLANDAGSTTGEIMATTYIGPQNIVYFCSFMSHSGDNTGSKGIVYYRLDPVTGAFTYLGKISCSLGYIGDSGDPYRPWLFSAYDNAVYEVVIDSTTGTPSIGTRTCSGTGMGAMSSTCWAVTSDHKFLYCLVGSKVGYAAINADGSLTYKGSYDLTSSNLLDCRCIAVSNDGYHLYVPAGLSDVKNLIAYNTMGIFQRNQTTGALTYQESQSLAAAGNNLIGQMIFPQDNTVGFFLTIYYVGRQAGWFARDPLTGRLTIGSGGIGCNPDTGNNIVYISDTGTLYATAWYSQYLMVIDTGIYSSPAPVTDLSAPAGSIQRRSLMLSWTAVANGNVGAAYRYDLRYSTNPITDMTSFNAATPITGLSSPRPAGSPEQFTVASLTPGATYNFAMIVYDGANHGSGLSNIVTATTLTGKVGDINNDGYVNVGDLQLLVAAWGSDNSGAWGNWNIEADLNNDGFINVADLQLLVANWAQ